MSPTSVVPDGRLAVMPGYAHMPHYSGPLALMPMLREFLAARSPDEHS
jgi:hypothetical protein